MEKERHEKFEKDLRSLIEEFQEETGFMIENICFNRSLLDPLDMRLKIPVVPMKRK